MHDGSAWADFLAGEVRRLSGGFRRGFRSWSGAGAGKQRRWRRCVEWAAVLKEAILAKVVVSDLKKSYQFYTNSIGLKWVEFPLPKPAGYPVEMQTLRTTHWTAGMVRDPDGYIVQLLQIESATPSPTTAGLTPIDPQRLKYRDNLNQTPLGTSGQWSLEKILALRPAEVLELWKRLPAPSLQEMNGHYMGLRPDTGDAGLFPNKAIFKEGASYFTRGWQALLHCRRMLRDQTLDPHPASGLPAVVSGPYDALKNIVESVDNCEGDAVNTERKAGKRCFVRAV